MISEMEERPPYVTFETRAIEDRNKTAETGVYEVKDVVYVLVTPYGTRDQHEAVASKWMEQQEQKAKQGKIPPQFLDYYKRAYKNYLESEDTETLDGHPIKTWATIGPSDQKRILNANIFTIEDLAAAPAEALDAIGMGALALKRKAQAWLDSGEQGKSAEKIVALEQEKERLQEQAEKQSKLIDELAARLEALESKPAEEDKPKRGRPAKAS